MSGRRRHPHRDPRPRTVRRVEHVEVDFDADGVTAVRSVKPPTTPQAGDGEYGEPCYDCRAA